MTVSFCILKMRLPFVVSIHVALPQIKEGLTHFASRDAMNISGLGPSIVEKLFAADLVRMLSDIYRLTVEDLLLLDGIKEKSAQKLYQAIQASKENSAEKLLFWFRDSSCRK